MTAITQITLERTSTVLVSFSMPGLWMKVYLGRSKVVCEECFGCTIQELGPPLGLHRCLAIQNSTEDTHDESVLNNHQEPASIRDENIE